MFRHTKINIAVILILAGFSSTSWAGNLLTNPSFESPATTGWTIVGAFGQGNSSPSAYDGSYYLKPTMVASGVVYQEIDLAVLGFDSHRLATGGYRARVEGYLYSGYPTSIGTISLGQYLADGSSNGSQVMAQSPFGGWNQGLKYDNLEPGTTKLIYVFNAHNSNTLLSNMACLDDASLEVSGYSLWTYGNVTSSFRSRDSKTFSGDYNVAASGTGEANVTRSKTWTTSGAVKVSDDNSARGTVNIDGGKWQANDVVNLADSGDAFVNVTGNGTWNSTKAVTMGQWSTGNATVNVNDGQWTSSSTVQIGKYGYGTVNVRSGGTWNSNGTVRTADVDRAKSYGEINVIGGEWSASGKNYIGMTLECDYLDVLATSKVNVTNGGKWTTSKETYLGYTTIGRGQANLNNSTWTSDSVVHVGYNGEGSVNLTGGRGWTSNQDVYLGRNAGSSGTVEITDGATWTANDYIRIGYEGTGQLTIGDGGELKTTSAAIIYVGTNAGVQGTVDISGGTWTDDANATWIGDFGCGTVNITDGGTWNSSSDVSLGYDWNGEGTINLTDGSWTATGAANIGMNGPGVLDIDKNGTWSTHGTTVVGRGREGEVTIDGGTWNAAGTSYISTYGDADVVLKNNALFDMTGELTIGAKGQLRLDSGTINLCGTWTNNGNIELNDGLITVEHSGSLNKINLYGGQMSVLGSGTTLGASDVTVGSACSLRIDQGATVAVGSGKALNVLSAIQLPNGDGTIQLNNGLLTHAQNKLQLNGGTLQGSGQVFVGTKGLDLGVDGSLVGTSSSKVLTVWGHVSGSGTLTNVTLYGDLNVGNSPGIINADSVTLTSSSTLAMELGGLIAGTEYDQILVEGPLYLDGALDIIWYDGFEARLGDSFTLFDLCGGGSIAGTFADEFLPSFTDATLSWDTTSLYTDGKITVTPEPGTILLLVIGFLALLSIRVKL